MEFDGKYVDLIVKNRQSYYKEKWDLIDKNERSWNWGACLGGPIWFIYRKMYLYAAVIFSATIVESFIEDMLEISEVNSQSMARAVSAAVAGFSGNYGNKLYRRYVKKTITRILKETNGNFTIEKLEKAGGTNIIGAVLSFIGILFCVL